MMGYKIFTLSPGSTSTKLAVFDGEEKLFKANVQHDPVRLKSFARVSEQMPYRVETILCELEKNRLTLTIWMRLLRIPEAWSLLRAEFFR